MTAAASQHSDRIPFRRSLCEKANPKNLRAVQKQNVAVLKTIPDLILIVDKHGQILDCNHNQNIFQSDSDECIDNTIDNVLPDKSARQLLKYIHRAFETGILQVFESRCNVWHHRDRHCEFRLVSIDDMQVLVIIRDITKRREAEIALRMEEERYRLLVETMNEGLVALNRQGKITFVNQAFSRLTGRKRGELLGQPIAEILPPKSRGLYSETMTNPSKSAPHPFKVSFDGKASTQTHALVSPQPLYDDVGKFRGSLSVYSDITELVKTTRRLEKRERELKKKSETLEESNIALKVLVERKLEDEDEIKNNVLQNVKELVQPYIEKLRESRLSNNQKASINILESNLGEIVSPFIRNLSSDYIRLTPQEIRIANYIRQGHATKEIASSLNLSTRTVDAHRNSIRRKLGINRKQTHLQTFLQSMTKNR
jgi:PAS domain S-box-containing protein